MEDEYLKTLFIYFLYGGAIGCVLGGISNVLSGPQKIRFDAALAIGFVIGSAFGALYGFFQAFV